MERSFKPYQNEHKIFSHGHQRKRQKTTIDLKISMKMLRLILIKILKASLKTFPTKMKPIKCPAKEEKMRQEKWKKRGGEKVKSKRQHCCVTFKHKNYLKIWLSVQAQTSQANILHLAQRVQPVNSFVVSFSSLWHDSDQKTAQLWLQNTVFNKISRGKKILRKDINLPWCTANTSLVQWGSKVLGSKKWY